MISGIIKVEASVISPGRRLKLITLAETSIIPDITKTEFNYCYIMHCFVENIQKLLCEIHVDFICASKNTRANAPSGCIARNHSSACAHVKDPQGHG